MTKATRETSIYQLIHVPNTKKNDEEDKIRGHGLLGAPGHAGAQENKPIKTPNDGSHEQSKVRGKFKMAPDRASSQHITSL